MGKDATEIGNLKALARSIEANATFEMSFDGDRSRNKNSMNATSIVAAHIAVELHRRDAELCTTSIGTRYTIDMIETLPTICE